MKAAANVPRSRPAEQQTQKAVHCVEGSFYSWKSLLGDRVISPLVPLIPTDSEVRPRNTMPAETHPEFGAPRERRGSIATVSRHTEHKCHCEYSHQSHQEVTLPGLSVHALQCVQKNMVDTTYYPITHEEKGIHTQPVQSQFYC